MLGSSWFYGGLLTRPPSSSKTYHMPIEQDLENLCHCLRGQGWMRSESFQREFCFSESVKTQWNSEGSSHLEFWPQSSSDVRRYPWQDFRWIYCNECALEVRKPPTEQGVSVAQRGALCQLRGRWLVSQMWTCPFSLASWLYSSGWNFSYVWNNQMFILKWFYKEYLYPLNKGPHPCALEESLNCKDMNFTLKTHLSIFLSKNPGESEKLK